MDAFLNLTVYFEAVVYEGQSFVKAIRRSEGAWYLFPAGHQISTAHHSAVASKINKTKRGKQSFATTLSGELLDFYVDRRTWTFWIDGKQLEQATDAENEAVYTTRCDPDKWLANFVKTMAGKKVQQVAGQLVELVPAADKQSFSALRLQGLETMYEEFRKRYRPAFEEELKKAYQAKPGADGLAPWIEKKLFFFSNRTQMILSDVWAVLRLDLTDEQVQFFEASDLTALRDLQSVAKIYDESKAAAEAIERENAMGSSMNSLFYQNHYEYEYPTINEDVLQSTHIQNNGAQNGEDGEQEQEKEAEEDGEKEAEEEAEDPNQLPALHPDDLVTTQESYKVSPNFKL